jgi:hypothetical protein
LTGGPKKTRERTTSEGSNGFHNDDHRRLVMSRNYFVVVISILIGALTGRMLFTLAWSFIREFSK